MTDWVPLGAETQLLLLSYPMAEDTPAYGGGPGLTVKQLTAVAAGDTANTRHVSLPNHLGTHVDCPGHFFDGAATLTDYEPSEWLFRRPCLVDVTISGDGLIGVEEVGEFIRTNADLLLIRTGHGESRGTDSYWQGGPGLSSELASWLRRECPSIRAVGVDLISITSRLNREEGRAAHRAFLDPAGPAQPIRLIEDMNLNGCPGTLDWVLCSPVFFSAADGGPVTVWGRAPAADMGRGV